LLEHHLDPIAWLLEKRINSEKWPSTGIASSRDDLAGCVVVAGQCRRRTSTAQVRHFQPVLDEVIACHSRVPENH